MSNALQFFRLSGGTTPSLYAIVTTSQTITAPCDGFMNLMGVAGGGSGGAASHLTLANATGGGASELVYDCIPVRAGDAFVITLGAGGGPVTAAAAGAAQGLDGTATTITGPNSYSLTIAPGKGGAATVGGGAINGGPGGFGGTGGTPNVVRYQGGRGGNISSATALKATGGGACNPFGLTAQTGTRGGDIITGATGQVATGGGGTYAASIDWSSGAYGTSGGAGWTTQTAYLLYLLPTLGILLNGTAGVGAAMGTPVAANGGVGAGGAGAAVNAAGNYYNYGGIFGGGGATNYTDQSSVHTGGGPGGYGAGGGAAITATSSWTTSTATNATSGAGYVVVSFVRSLK